MRGVRRGRPLRRRLRRRFLGVLLPLDAPPVVELLDFPRFLLHNLREELVNQVLHRPVEQQALPVPNDNRYTARRAPAGGGGAEVVVEAAAAEGVEAVRYAEGVGVEV